MKYTVNDFFCGAGGIGIGFQQAGFDVIWACDFDKYCVETYKENVGKNVILADIKNLTSDDIPNANVWAFGFPCQDSSVAGKRKGFVLTCKECEAEWNATEETENSYCPVCKSTHIKAVTRSAMFFEIMRLIDEKKNKEKIIPEVLFIENVKGLKKYLPIVIKELEKRNYTAFVKLYNSKYWGVPQSRERYFIVAIQNNINDFDMPTELYDKKTPLYDFIDKKVEEKYFVNKDVATEVLKQACEKLNELGKIHATLTPARAKKRQCGPRAKAENAEMFTLTAQDIHGVIIDDTYGYESVPRIYLDEVPTLRSGRQGIKVITEAAEKEYLVRRLTPVEYGRLQGFPMEKWKQVVSDSQAYKQFGNAVTVNVVNAIAENIKEYLKKTEKNPDS